MRVSVINILVMISVNLSAKTYYVDVIVEDVFNTARVLFNNIPFPLYHD